MSDEPANLSIPGYSKLETWNTLFWFSMDGLWMWELTFWAALLTIPTLLTGIWIVLRERTLAIRAVELSMFFWILMNSTWLLSEFFESERILILTRTSFFLAVGCLAFAFSKSSSGEVWKYFKRFRISKENFQN